MWQIEYTNIAQKFIKLLDSKDKERIMKSVESLQNNPNLGKQLVGPLKGLRSLRVGRYRIIYKKEINELIILIVAIGHRKNIYRSY